MFLKIFEVSADEEMGKLVLAWLAREEQDILTSQPMFTYSHANTSLGPSERA